MNIKKLLLIFSLLTCFVIEKSIAQNTSENKAKVEETQDNTDNDGLETIKIRRKVSSVSKGFRIQIYSGPDREAAKATKVSFMKRFPSVRSYITYEVPYYKIKVGDFKTRNDAMEFNRYLSKTFTTMVVPSLINNKIPPKVNIPSSNNTEESDTKAAENNTEKSATSN